MPPKKDNPGGGGNGGGGNGGGGVTFAVTGLTGDSLTGTGPAGEVITVTVTDAAGNTWVARPKEPIGKEGTWSILLSDFTGPNDLWLSDQSGTFTVVATYTEINPKNNKEKTVSTEETALFLPSENALPVISLETGDSASETLVETDARLTVSGTLSVTDLDAADVVTASITDVVAEGTTTTDTPDEATLLAMLSLASTTAVPANATDARLSWTFESGTEAFDYLEDTESLILSYTIAVSDGNGGTDSQVVQITIDGTAETQAPPALTGFDYIGEDTGLDGDRVTSDATATFRISFNSGVATGDTITLVVNGRPDASVTLTGDDIAAGFVDLTTSEVMVEGENTIFTRPSFGGDSAPILLTLDTIAPGITGPAALSLDENQARTAAFESDDPTATWSLTGADAALFQIDAAGLLSFRTAPDFEAPEDANGDNIYEVTLGSADLAGNQSTLGVSVTVDNVVEPVSPPTSYETLVVFGDSLSDNGNFAALAADFLKPGYSVPFQYDGGDGSVRTYNEVAFTDGTVYADTLAGLLALETSYENYAFGGAQALGEKLGGDYIEEYSALPYYDTSGTLLEPFSIVENKTAALDKYKFFDINLGAQVDRYLDPQENQDGVLDGTLAVINIGANDLGEFDANILNILFGGINAFAADVGAEIETQARRLADAGVAGIALYTLPVAEFFIGYNGLEWYEKPAARDLIDSVNDEIFAAARALSADGITTDVVRLDIMSIDILDNMQTHGFLFKGPYLRGYSGDPTWVQTPEGVIEPVFDVNAAATAYRPEQLLFFDEIHPSGALHDVLAIFSSESLTTDEVFGSGGGDVITLGAADDFVLGLAGSDDISLGAGEDVALGGLGNDTLRGEDGSDLLIGGAGSDILEGGAGSDLLAGSAGDDQLSGGSGADLLIGGLGSDSVFGGPGNDVFIFFEEALWGGTGNSTDTYDGGDGDQDILLVFHTSPVTQDDVGTTTTLSFGDGTTIETTDIETIELHMGLPDDGTLASLTGSFSDDLLARYLEAENWGVI